MAAATLIRATCEIVGKEKEGNYGPYRPVLFALPNGEQKWKSYKPDAPELTWLRKGESYQAVIVGDEFKLVDPNGQAAPPPAPAPQPQQTPEDRRVQICRYVESIADLMVFCRQAAIAKLGPDADEETIRCSTQALLIQTCKKFSL